MGKLPAGLYELLYTKGLLTDLTEEGLLGRSHFEKIPPEEIYQYLCAPLAREISSYIRESLKHRKQDDILSYLEETVADPERLSRIIDGLLPVDNRILHEIYPAGPLQKPSIRPDTLLCESALLTGSSRTPSLQSQLIKELETCDRADWLVSFIKFAGIRQLMPALQRFTRKPTEDGSPRLRIATTSYMGATDIKAIQLLLTLPHTEIKVSLDTKRTRLHAKAYLFHRDTGFSSAYVGSANVSKAAMNEGLEWTAKISQFESLHLWHHSIATFESHWEDPREFISCNHDNLPEFIEAIRSERNQVFEDNRVIQFYDLRPYGFQQVILEEIAAERVAGKHKHLIIAATGTGKTIVSAFDYQAFCRLHGGQPRLLFVAHREEILKQALATFRQVLKDGSFGELLAGGNTPSSLDHLFCTVQSWNAKDMDSLESGYYDYIVLDEAHHAYAPSYQRLIHHIEPKSLLGLTATPERSDGGDIRDDFGGTFTHELRLTEAVERSLLCPFHYYGIPDEQGIDLSMLKWVRGGYQDKDLEELLSTNDRRAEWILSQTDNYVADLSTIRGLGFCISITHAQFMAEKFNASGVPSRALTSKSSKEERRTVQKLLKDREIRFIFTVDLYNEGVDIPFVDTVLFLRPTESLTVFLQQLGRGLRLHDDKAQLTVLDFIAPQNRQFDFISRYRALSMRPERRVDDQIRSGMPFVPTGCFIHLERKAEATILDTIRNTTLNMRGRRFYQQMERLVNSTSEESISLRQIMDWFHISDPDEIYKRGIPSKLLAAGRKKTDKVQDPFDLHKGFRRLLLNDDTCFFHEIEEMLSGGSSTDTAKQMLHVLLWGKKRPGAGTLDDVQEYIMTHPGIVGDLLDLIDWINTHKAPMGKMNFTGTGVLNLHGSYSREQILLALGKGSFIKPYPSREGVLHIPERKIDIFFADINKSEADFSPTTMYEDYAITDSLFHWQSQSLTGEETKTGRRYINHEDMGYTPYLFIRNRNKAENGLTAPYLFAGPLHYRKHQGSRPMSIIWEMEKPLPAKVLRWARRVG